MKNIHILLGSKGGIGVTRCCISLAMYYLLKREEKIAIFDANFRNTDLFTLMAGQKAANQPLLHNEKFYSAICCSKKNPLIQYLCYVKKNKYKMYKGAVDFWMKINQVVKDIINYENTNQSEVNNLIIDTNQIFPNFIPFTHTEKDSISKILKNIKNIGIKNIIIWYIWNLNDFLYAKKSETISIESAIRDFGTISHSLFSAKKNIINVLNPYLFIDKRKEGIFASFIHNVQKLLAVESNTLLPVEKSLLTITDLTKFVAKIILKIVTAYESKVASEIIVTPDRLLRQLGDYHINVLVLEYDKEGENYIRDTFIIRSEKPVEVKENKYIVDLNVLHRNSFGVTTIWKKTEEYLPLILK